MTEMVPEWGEPQAGSPLRGRFVKWPTPGDTVEGVVTFVDLQEGSHDGNGNVHGLLQVYDPSVGDQGDDGFYRKIDLNKKGLLAEVDRCVRSGLQVGWHIRLTFVEALTSQKNSTYTWKRFKSLLARPTLSEEKVAELVEGGRRYQDDIPAPVQQPVASAPAGQVAAQAPALTQVQAHAQPAHVPAGAADGWSATDPTGEADAF